MSSLFKSILLIATFLSVSTTSYAIFRPKDQKQVKAEKEDHQSTFLSYVPSSHPYVIKKYDQFISSLQKLSDAGKLDASSKEALLDALLFAAEKHQGEFRKGMSHNPYIVHPLRVVNILMERAHVEDVDILTAAILHDIVQGNPDRLNQVHRNFGQQVASYIAELSDDLSLPFEERKAYQVERAQNVSKGAALIIIADKLDNIESIHLSPPLDWGKEQKFAYVAWADQVVRNLPAVNFSLYGSFQKAVMSFYASLHKSNGK